MHPAFREGFEKAGNATEQGPTTKLAWWGESSLHDPSSRAKRLFNQGKTVGKDVMGGMGLGKGLMPKAFGAMTALDVVSKTRAAMAKPRGLTGIPMNF
jgi:hypothetical protein